jgi:hypothetical protein
MVALTSVGVVSGVPNSGTGDVSTLDAVLKAEDAASGNGDILMPIGVRRTLVPANTSGTDGDFEYLQINDGKLWTQPLMLPFRVTTSVVRPADTAVYAAGDAITNSTSAPTAGGMTFSNIARVSGGMALITGMKIFSDNDPATRLSGELFLFNTAATAVNDNAAFVVSDSEILTCEGVIPFSMFDAGNNNMAHISNLAMVVSCVGSANLRGALRARNAYTPANGETITITLDGFWIN